jgi:hypothetical protein
VPRDALGAAGYQARAAGSGEVVPPLAAVRPGLAASVDFRAALAFRGDARVS